MDHDTNMTPEDQLFDKISCAVTDAVEAFVSEAVAAGQAPERNMVFDTLDSVFENIDSYGIVKYALRQHGLWD